MPAAAALRFVGQIDRMSEPAEILDNLQRVATVSDVFVLATIRLRTKLDDFTGPKDGRWLFKHPRAPLGFIHDWKELTRQHGASAMRRLALREFQPFTYTEALRALRPTGQDRWIFELTARHGIRDGLYCPLGRWMLNYGSPHVLKLSTQQRASLVFSARVAVMRLEQLVGRHKRDGGEDVLTARERTILQRLSFGHSTAQVARDLDIHPGTVGTFLRRAERKLAGQNRTHTVAEAVRRNLII